MRQLRLFPFLTALWLGIALTHAAVMTVDEGYAGCNLEQKKGSDFLWVENLVVGGPAEEAGIKNGDCIIAFNGISTEKMSTEKGRRHLHGDIGTTFTMTVRREGIPDADLTLVRRSLPDAYTKAAVAGDTLAQFTLGCYYEYSKTAPDPARAVDFFRKAAEQGYASAQVQLGYRMKYGVGMPKDESGGVAWYLKAAKQGNVYAERDLGLSYLQGEGLPQSDHAAFAWLYTSAIQDDSTAESNLAYLYQTGRGVTLDYKASYAWYYRAAQHNDAYGEWGLGYMYQHGYGVKKDLGEAIKWYRKAEVGLPKDESLKKAIALANLEAFIETPNTKDLDLTQLLTLFKKQMLIGLYFLTSVYVVMGVILFVYSLRKPQPAGIAITLGWIALFVEGQGVAYLAVLLLSKSLQAHVLVAAIALFGAVPVIVSTLGAGRSRIWKAPSLSWGKLVLYVGGSCAALMILGVLYGKAYVLVMHSPMPEQPTMALFVKSKDASAWLTFASLALIMPAAEEILFRGYLFDTIRRYLPASVTILITALLFATVHLQGVYFLPLCLVGMVLGWVRHKSDSLWPSFALHALNNGLIIAAFH